MAFFPTLFHIHELAWLMLATLVLSATVRQSIPDDGETERINACRIASDECKFRFDHPDKVPKFHLPNHWDQAFTPVIVSKKRGEFIGLVNTNGIYPQVVSRGGNHRLSTLRSLPSIPDTALKPYPMVTEPGSGIGNQFLKARQRRALSGKCFRVYFSTYELVDDNGYVKGHVHNLRAEDNACVVFKIEDSVDSPASGPN